MCHISIMVSVNFHGVRKVWLSAIEVIRQIIELAVNPCIMDDILDILY